jgi:hypothetical protein
VRLTLCLLAAGRERKRTEKSMGKERGKKGKRKCFLEICLEVMRERKKKSEKYIFVWFAKGWKMEKKKKIYYIYIYVCYYYYF